MLRQATNHFAPYFIFFSIILFWSSFGESMISVTELDATLGIGKTGGWFIGGLELGGGFKEKNGLLLGA